VQCPEEVFERFFDPIRNMGMRPVEIYLESALETAKRVLSRRKVEQTREDVKLLTTVLQTDCPRKKRFEGIETAAEVIERNQPKATVGAGLAT